VIAKRAVGGFMKLTALGATVLLLGLPSAMPAQKANLAGEIAKEPKVTLPPSFSAEAHTPATAARPADIANVPDQREKHIKTLWMASIVAMLAGTSMDAISSWHKTESNSLLASSNGMFGARGVGIKAGIAAGVLLPQIILRKRKDLRIPFTVGNLAEAGVFTGAAVHNFHVAQPHY
jgi:hypothetical protein